MVKLYISYSLLITLSRTRKKTFNLHINYEKRRVELNLTSVKSISYR